MVARRDGHAARSLQFAVVGVDVVVDVGVGQTQHLYVVFAFLLRPTGQDPALGVYGDAAVTAFA
jgi:hypothetical protein